MLKIMKQAWLLILIILNSNVASALEHQWTVSAEDWSRPRNGEAIAGMTPVVQSVQSLLQTHISSQSFSDCTPLQRHHDVTIKNGAMKNCGQDSGYQLVIRYPGGEAGMLWARELRDWMVSLGLTSTLVTMEAGSSRDDVVTIHLMQREGL